MAGSLSTLRCSPTRLEPTGSWIPRTSASRMRRPRRSLYSTSRNCPRSTQSSITEATGAVDLPVEVLYSQALEMARSENFEQARELFQTVAERFPHFEKNWISWAQMEKRAHARNSERKWDSCRLILQRALSQHPRGPRIIQAWGLMELQKQNFRAAVMMLDRSVLYDPILKPVLLWKPVLEARRRRALEKRANNPLVSSEGI